VRLFFVRVAIPPSPIASAAGNGQHHGSARRPRPGSANRSPAPHSVQRPAVRISPDPDPGMKDAIPSGNCNSGQRLPRARRTMKHLNIGVPRCTRDLVERPRVGRHRRDLGFPVDTTFTRIPGGRGGISRYAVRSSCDHAASPFMPPQWRDRRPFGKTPVPTLAGGRAATPQPGEVPAITKKLTEG
jgi:hypothetical protein